MIRALQKAVRDRLTGGTALTALLSSGSAVYWNQAGVNAALPYIIVNINAGGMVNDNPRNAFDVNVAVWGIATDAATAGQIADAIYDRLHKAELSYSSYGHVACQQVSAISYVENADRVVYHYAGGLYRVRASD
jgi:hypothetical protein